MISRIRRTLAVSLHIGYKDLLTLIRDRMMLISFIIMPMFMMVMMGYVFPSQSALKDVPLGLVNQDQGPLADSIVQPLSQIKLGDNGQTPFQLRQVSTPEAAKEEIKKGQLNGAIVIPADFSARVSRGEQATITLISDQSNPQLSSMLTQVLSQIIDQMSTKFGASLVASMSPQPGINAEALVKPFTVTQENIVPGKPNYFQFMAPGIMAMVVVFAVMMGIAGSVVRERELGTLDGVLVAPISRLSIILGKTLAQSVRGLVQAGIVLGLAMALFGVTIHGSILLVVLLLLLGILSFIGLGVLISAVSTQQETAMTIMMTLQFPMLFLSGAFFPVQQMPSAVQFISKVVPLTYAVEGLRRVVVLGAGFSAVALDVVVLAGFGVVMLAIAIPAFNRVITR